MSYDKNDFILMTRASGNEVAVNISKIKFVTEEEEERCRLYFSGGKDDFIIVKCTLDQFMEIL